MWLVAGQDQFTGDIRIELEILQPTSTIWLNAKALEFQNGTMTQGNSRLVAQFESAPNDFLAVKAPKTLAAGTSGWYIFTKFEPVTARRVFPCFDEPSFKVPWTLTTVTSLLRKQ